SHLLEQCAVAVAKTIADFPDRDPLIFSKVQFPAKWSKWTKAFTGRSAGALGAKAFARRSGSTWSKTLGRRTSRPARSATKATRQRSRRWTLWLLRKYNGGSGDQDRRANGAHENLFQIRFHGLLLQNRVLP